MTAERVTRDVRLREEERDDMARALHDATPTHRRAAIDMRPPCECRWKADQLAPVVERIVAARVGEVVERVEAVGSFDAYLTVAPMVRVRVMHEHDVRTALRAADAPVAGGEGSGGHGGRASEDRAEG